MTAEELEAQVQAIIRRPYHRVVTGEPSEGYLAQVPELPGCFTAGETPEDPWTSADSTQTAMASSRFRMARSRSQQRGRYA